MKSLFWFFMVAAAITLPMAAGEAIPPELVGDWRSQDGQASLQLRADGLCFIGTHIGAAGIATYDVKNLLLTLSLRHDRTGNEVGKVTVLYDPKALTLTPREEGFRLATYKRRSADLPEPFKSVDLKKVLNPSK